MTSACPSPNTLSVLAAKQEISEVIHLYCRAMDRIDRKLGLEIWHPGGTVDYAPAFTGKTAAEFVEWVSTLHENLAGTSHQIGNVVIEVDGDRATSESYLTAVLRIRGEDGLIDRVIRGRYLDKWSRRDDRWAIDHRKYVRDMEHFYPLPA